MIVAGREVDSAWLSHLGGRITYRTVGNAETRSLEAGRAGEPIVMVHGAGGHAEVFLRNIVPLGERGFRVCAVDLLGHGLTTMKSAKESLRIKDYVNHLADFIQDLDLGPVALVGHSLGGLLAMKLTSRFPDSVAAVVNVTGGGLRTSATAHADRRRIDQLHALSAAVATEGSWEAWRARMNWLVRDPLTMPDEMVAIRIALSQARLGQSTVEREWGAHEALKSDDPEAHMSQEDLRTFPRPVLYLWGDNTTGSPVEIARQAKELTPDSELVVMSDCGHWPQWEDSERFNNEVEVFLRGSWARPRQQANSR